MNSAGGGNVPTDAGRYVYAPVCPEIIRPIERKHPPEVPEVERAHSRDPRNPKLEDREPATRTQHTSHFRAGNLGPLHVANAERDRCRIGDAIARGHPHRISADEHDAPP